MNRFKAFLKSCIRLAVALVLVLLVGGAVAGSVYGLIAYHEKALADARQWPVDNSKRWPAKLKTRWEGGYVDYSFDLQWEKGKEDRIPSSAPTIAILFYDKDGFKVSEKHTEETFLHHENGSEVVTGIKAEGKFPMSSEDYQRATSWTFYAP